jgi:methyl-accepting chemotaxis protein
MEQPCICLNYNREPAATTYKRNNDDILLDEISGLVQSIRCDMVHGLGTMDQTLELLDVMHVINEMIDGVEHLAAQSEQITTALNSLDITIRTNDTLLARLTSVKQSLQAIDSLLETMSAFRLRVKVEDVEMEQVNASLDASLSKVSDALSQSMRC